MTAVHATIENVSRRGFLKGLLATGGLVVAAEFAPARGAFAAYATGAAKMAGGVVSDPHVFVSIDPSGLVTIVAHRAEMGTGSRTSLPMAVADELEADWSRVKVVQSPGDEKKYGNQNTDGSRSLRHFIQPMRECGAARGRCSKPPRPCAGAYPLAKCRPRTTRSYTSPQAISSVTATSPRRQADCRRRLPIKSSSRIRRRSAISGKATSRSSTCSTSRPAVPSTASTPSSPG